MALQDGAPFRYSRAVPERYHRSSGLEVHRFRIIETWHSPFRYIRLPDGQAEEIRPAALCVLSTRHGPLPVLVDLKRHPRLAEGVLQFASAFAHGNRTERYLELFKAYECVVKQRRSTVVALRHSLAHSRSALTRPKTVAALKRLFRDPKVSYWRCFYHEFVKMLIDTDVALAKAVLENRLQLRELTRPDDALHDWQIPGIPGVYDPIPVRPTKRPNSACSRQRRVSE